MDEWIRLVTYPILDEFIIPNSQLNVKNFFRARLFFQDEWIRLVTYPILDEFIILELEPHVKNFFRARFFFQGEWVGLFTNLILYGLIILYLNQLVKKKILSFSFSFGMDFSVSECVDLFLSKKSLDFLASLSYNKTIKRQGWSLCSYP